MRKAQKLITLCMSVVVVASFMSSVYAQPRFFGGKGNDDSKRRKGELWQKLVNELGLNQEQQEQIKAQRSRQDQKGKQLGQKLKMKTSQLRKELESQEINEANVRRIIADLKELTGHQLEQHVDRILSIRKILNPEQYEKLKATIKEKKQQMKQRGHFDQQGSSHHGGQAGGFWHRMWGREQHTQRQQEE
ncbi:Spy/CpxP family protein refolding chaperone [Candidatus Omnitrophota bacterium]